MSGGAASTSGSGAPMSNWVKVTTSPLMDDLEIGSDNNLGIDKNGKL